ELRFIEWMPLDFSHSWSREKLVPADEILARIGDVFPIRVAHGEDPSAPATLYEYLDGAGRVGVIASVTRPFCGHCDRIRLTADGQIRTCLFSLKEYDFRRLMRGGGSDEEVAALLKAAVWRKEPGHLINSPYFRQPERGMSAIGGYVRARVDGRPPQRIESACAPRAARRRSSMKPAISWVGYAASTFASSVSARAVSPRSTEIWASASRAAAEAGHRSSPRRASRSAAA